MPAALSDVAMAFREGRLFRGPRPLPRSYVPRDDMAAGVTRLAD
jgi:hypothetical protein